MSDNQSMRHESTLPGPLGWIDAWLGRAEALMLGAGVLLMAFNTVANVVGRFVFQNSLFFTEEVNRILIVMITFAGIGYAARHGRHIRMSAIFDALPTSARKWMMVFIAFVTAMVMFALTFFSVRYIGSVADSGRILPSLQIPVWWIFLWVPLGLAVTGIQYLLTALKNLVSRDVYLSTQVLDGYDDDETEV
ncbi:TRAP transporter small permease [Marinobacterium sp. AK62]|uniref:TRAP transporter small permease protein n=1 Tax=Marinobacterium alkalitolerans TaxID=1542925 RepID=A0ABS3ZF07_9GAMM|nr:TRAP transporter small permease [Marinobacterium alkalitolerans]MBP0049634.1 TRAP transporter small permease [Marinobacterium alkalitolerans]